MKELNNVELANEADEDLESSSQLDPSSISLFSNVIFSQAPAVYSNTESSANADTNELIKDPTSLTIPPILPFIKDLIEPTLDKKKPTSYSSYVAGKATEVAKRRNLNERIDKLKSSHGIVFNIPQFQEITLNQLAIFLRRLRKSSDVRQIMSMELMLKVFQEDKNENTLAKNEVVSIEKSKQPIVANQRETLLQNIKIEQQKYNSNCPAVISVNDLFGDSDDRISVPSTSLTSLKDDEDDLTECSTDDELENVDGMEIDDYVPSTSQQQNFLLHRFPYNHKRYEFYKRRLEILSADIRAVTIYKRLSETETRVQSIYKNLSEDLVKFGASKSIDIEEEDSQTCARCRPFLHRPHRQLVYTNFFERRNRVPRRITPNLRCGPVEYSAVDDSIHPFLSLSSAIPMERKAQKYLQVSGTLPREIERRRRKTADLAFKKNEKINKKLFHFAEELTVPEEDTSTPSTIISLNLKKKQLNKKEDENGPLSTTSTNSGATRSGRGNYKYGVDFNDSSDSGDMNYSPRTGKRNNLSILSNGQSSYSSRKTSNLNRNKQVGQKMKKIVTLQVEPNKGRRKRFKKIKKDQDYLENRRLSVHSSYGRDDYGGSIFDFDSSFTDIGLTAVKNAENKEIAIPLFRQKDILDYSVKKPCNCCESFCEDPFSKIRQLHEVLELQERHRFKLCKGPRSRP